MKDNTFAKILTALLILAIAFIASAAEPVKFKSTDTGFGVGEPIFKENYPSRGARIESPPLTRS